MFELCTHADAHGEPTLKYTYMQRDTKLNPIHFKLLLILEMERCLHAVEPSTL